MKRPAFYFNSQVCSGCKTCQIACQDKNDLATGVHWRRVYEVTGGSWQKVGNAWRSDIIAYHISISCNHCENPVCMDACPAKAISKGKDGIVRVDPNRCMGCRYCSWVCPYSALQYDAQQGVMGKCDLCADYVSRGRNPSCVDACPTRAMDFGEYDELVSRYGETSHIHPLPDQKITGPSFLVHPHRSALQEGNQKAEISNMEEI